MTWIEKSMTEKESIGMVTVIGAETRLPPDSRLRLELQLQLQLVPFEPVQIISIIS